MGSTAERTAQSTARQRGSKSGQGLVHQQTDLHSSADLAIDMEHLRDVMLESLGLMKQLRRSDKVKGIARLLLQERGYSLSPNYSLKLKQIQLGEQVANTGFTGSYFTIGKT